MGRRFAALGMASGVALSLLAIPGVAQAAVSPDCAISQATGGGTPSNTITLPEPTAGDMSSTIEAAFARSGSETVVQRPGTYYITRPVVIPRGDVFDGAGIDLSRLKALPGHNVNPMVKLQGDATLRNMTVDQNGADPSSRQDLSQYTVDVRGSNNDVDHTKIVGYTTYALVAAGAERFCFHNGVILGDPALNGRFNQLDGAHVLNSRLGDVVRMYVDGRYNGATAGDDSFVAHVIDGGTVSDVRYVDNVARAGANGTAFAVWPYSGNITRISFSGNEVWGDGQIGHGEGYGGSRGTFTDSSITDNIVHNTGENAISMAGKNLTVTGNKTCSTGPIRVTGSNNTVGNNSVYSGCVAEPSWSPGDPPVIDPPKPAVNQPPQVNAGLDRIVRVGRNVRLNGVVTDDGLPIGALGYVWEAVSGPAIVPFSNPWDLHSLTRFDKPGKYVLRLKGSDGAVEVQDLLVDIAR